MAPIDRSKLKAKDYAIGAGIVGLCFVVVFLLAAFFVPAAPQWLLSVIAAILGIALWNRFMQKRNS